MRPSIQDVHEWDRENVRLLSPGEVRHVSIQRNTLIDHRKSRASTDSHSGGPNLLGCAGFGDGQTNTEDGIGTKLSLV